MSVNFSSNNSNFCLQSTLNLRKRTMFRMSLFPNNSSEVGKKMFARIEAKKSNHDVNDTWEFLFLLERHKKYLENVGEQFKKTYTSHLIWKRWFFAAFSRSNGAKSTRKECYVSRIYIFILLSMWKFYERNHRKAFHFTSPFQLVFFRDCCKSPVC